MPSSCSPRSARGASTCTTTTSCRSTPRRPSATASSSEFKDACDDDGIVVPMATVNLFFDPVVPRRRVHGERRPPCAPTRCRRRCARWTSARSSARRSSCCGAAARAPRPMRAGEPTTRSSGCARRSTTSASTRSTAKYGYRFALEAKPNEPRGDIYMATTGNYLGLIPTLAHPGDGRRQPGSGARADGRTQLRARRRAGLGSGQAVPHRPERPGCPAATTRTSGSARRTRRPRSSS